MTDPYAILGVAKTATDQEIKQAYRKLAIKHHPDKGGDGDKFAEINAAYDLIRNSELREQYEQSQRQPNYENSFNSDPWANFQDMFAQQFGGQNPFQQRVKNQDIHITFYATLEDLFSREVKHIDIKFNNKTKKVSIRIPAGITDGTEVRYSGYGDDSLPGRQAGDLYVTYKLKAHPDYTVEEFDLVKRLNISIRDAMLGSEQIIKTLDGRNLKVNINPGTQSKTRLRIPESGLPRRNLPNGNLYVEINVTIPKLTITDLDRPLKDVL